MLLACVATEYFVSNFDFYQPEAYIPSTDTYIDKSAYVGECYNDISKLKLFDELDKNVRAKYLDGSEPNPLMRYMLELIRDEGTYGMLTKLLQTRVTLYDNIGEVEKDNRSHEIWFSGPCIAVRNNSGILERLNINAR